MIGSSHGRWARRLAVGGMSVLLALAFSSVGAGNGPTPAAAASVGCDYNRSCTGLDPQAMGCSADAYTMDTVSPIGFGTTVELRYSPACFAVWARDTDEGWWFSAQGANSNGGTPVVKEVVNGGSWTRMVSFQLWTRACVRPAGYPQDESTWTCTRSH